VTSLIAKSPNPNFSRTQQECEAEIDFYTRVATRVSLPVPACYFGAYDSDTGRSVLLLEDLSEVQPGHPGGIGCDRSETAAALAALARLQGAHWGSEELEAVGLKRQPMLGVSLTEWISEAESRWKALHAAGVYTVERDVAALIDSHMNSFVESWPRLEVGPFTLVHDDMHIQNFLLSTGAEGRLEMTILDWQEATIGHPVRDLCQLLGGNTQIDVQRRDSLALIEEYLALLLSAGGRGWSLAQVLKDLSIATSRLVIGYIRFLFEYTPISPEDQALLQLEFARITTSLQVSQELAPI
jgi:hypothetical protein